jgi:3-dehydroquinate synthase
MSLTSYRAAPPRVPRRLYNAPASGQRKRYCELPETNCKHRLQIGGVAQASPPAGSPGNPPGVPPRGGTRPEPAAGTAALRTYLKLATVPLAFILSPVRIVNVPLGNRSYEIQIGSGLLKDLGKQCDRLQLGKRCAIISDSNVAPQYAGAVQASLVRAGFDPVLITFPAGETAKRLESVQRCYEKLAAHRLERKSFIVALGGGVVGDLAGFIAATYLRGIAFVQVPTTLLAHVDSSVGGKVGVNLKSGKNLVGAFHQPRLVVCDLDTFRTLPEREFRSGLAEVIKYGIIYDVSLFERLERELPRLLRRDSKTLGAVIARCCEIKADVVGNDETEGGLRAILNFGHTIGHALEAISSYGKYLHGEAISIGQVAAADVSAQLLGFPRTDVERVRTLFQRAGLPVLVKLNAAQCGKLFAAMRLDKKVSGGEIKFVLAPQIGKTVWDQKVPEPVIQSALTKLAS